LCTVDRIVGTNVFVKITTERGEIEGGIVTSEIAPGRIRNLRDYVVPKKKIVCKILRISQQGNIELSLRRVTQKERKEVLENESLEKSYISILKSILGSQAEEAIKRILDEERVFPFLEEAKTNPKKLENLVGRENAERIIGILNAQRRKKIKVKKEIELTTLSPSGISIIKKILEAFKGIDVRYLAAGRYSLELESEDAKMSDKLIREKIIVAEKEAKKLGADFSIK